MAATTPAPGTASTGMVKLSCADALIHHVTVKQGIRVGFKLQVLSDFDISSVVFFKSAERKSNKTSASSVREYQVAPTQLVQQRIGSYMPPEDGELVFLFDNSYSWFNSKEIELTLCFAVASATSLGPEKLTVAGTPDNVYDGSYTAVVGDDAIVHKQQHYVSDTGNVHLYFGSTSRWLIKDVFTPKDETALGYMSLSANGLPTTAENWKWWQPMAGVDAAAPEAAVEGGKPTHHWVESAVTITSVGPVDPATIIIVNDAPAPEDMAFTPDGPATPAATPAAARASGPADVGALVAQVLVPALSTAEQYDEAIRLLGERRAALVGSTE